MDTRNNKKCVICHKRRHCGSNIFLSQFPLDSDRCRVWVKNAGIEDLAYLPIEKLHQLKYICGSHFSPASFNSKGTRLKKTAIPTVDLRNPILPDEVLTEFPLHLKSSTKANLTSNLRIQEVAKQDENVAIEEIEYLDDVQGEAEVSHTEDVVTEACDDYALKSGTANTALTQQAKQPSTEAVPVPIAKILSSEPMLPHFAIPPTQQTNPMLEPPSYKKIQEQYKTLNKVFLRLQKRHELLKKRVKTNKKQIFQKLTANMNPVARNFFRTQLWAKKTNGVRFSAEEKILALSILKLSGACYSLLQKIFILPSKHTLQVLYKSITAKDIPSEQDDLNQLVAKVDEVQNKDCETDSSNVLQDEPHVVQDRLNQSLMPQDSLHQSHVLEDNVDMSNVFQDSVNDSNVLQDSVNESNVLRDSVNESNGLQDNVNESNVLQSNVNKSNVLQDNVNESNVLQGSVNELHVLQDSVNVLQGGLNESKVFKTNVNESNVILVNLNDSNLVKDSFKRHYVLQDVFDQSNVLQDMLIRSQTWNEQKQSHV